MKNILTLFFPLLGMLSCAEEYDFQPYEPEKTVVSELTLLEYDLVMMQKVVGNYRLFCAGFVDIFSEKEIPLDKVLVMF